MILLKEVVSAKDYKHFVDFPFKLYKDNSYWIPPIKKEELKILKPETNPAFKFCDAKFWTAWNDNKCVGRIGAIINHDYNKKIGLRVTRCVLRVSGYEVRVIDCVYQIF